MALDDFEQNPDGTVKVCPLAGWDSFTPFGMMCGLRIRYANSASKLLAQDFDAVPLIMTVAQARELASVLIRCAEKAEAPPSNERTQ